MSASIASTGLEMFILMIQTLIYEYRHHFDDSELLWRIYMLIEPICMFGRSQTTAVAHARRRTI